MNISEAITLCQWRKLSERVGGSLFQDRSKLEAMRRIDKSFGPEVSWDKFCDLVVADIEGKFIVAPTSAGKGLSAEEFNMVTTHFEKNESKRNQTTNKGADK